MVSALWMLTILCKHLLIKTCSLSTVLCVIVRYSDAYRATLPLRWSLIFLLLLPFQLSSIELNWKATHWCGLTQKTLMLLMQEHYSSYIVCEEPHSIVQLSYTHRYLLISTEHRTFLYSIDEQRTVTQVGRQQRKTSVSPSVDTRCCLFFTHEIACHESDVNLTRFNSPDVMSLTV